MATENESTPDSTAIRVALWRALHVEADPTPHVLRDEIGLKLVAPDPNWRERPDMHPLGTSRFRASIVARARFIEDLVSDEMSRGTHQYVILGAGLDTFAQRNANLISTLQVFEVDAPETQNWKRRRLSELGYQVPNNLHFVPMNFEDNSDVIKSLSSHGFDPSQPAIVSSLGVSMYLTKDAILSGLSEMVRLAPGSKYCMTFMLPIEMVDPEDQPGYRMAEKGARASGTPFISFFAPDEMLAFAKQVGFRGVEHFSTASLTPRIFGGRPDGLRPSTGEELLIATV